MERNLKSEKAVTLITLVVTIIVLLILAGITIGNLTSDKGVIKEAKTAKEQTEMKGVEEQIELAIIKAEQKHRNPTIDDVIQEMKNAQVISDGDTQVNRITGEIRSDLGYVIKGKLDNYIESKVINAKRNGTVFTSNTKITDTYGNTITIPEGFKIASDSANDVTGGVVIEDVNHTATAGSQFVWIPVGTVYTNVNKTESKTINLNRYTFAGDGTPTAQGTNTIDTYYQELATSTSGNATAKDIEAFKASTSAEKAGGYYIGRYEASIGTQRTAETDNSGLGQVTVKGNEYVYNYVTQLQASTLSRNMYSSTNFESDLINSYAWDTAIVFIQEFSGDTDYARQIFYQATLAKTGEATDGTNKDVRCNIYDMAGNTSEWSTETFGNSGGQACVDRGGTYTASAGGMACERADGSSFVSVASISFRPILYVK